MFAGHRGRRLRHGRRRRHLRRRARRRALVDELVDDDLDMVVGARVETAPAAYRARPPARQPRADRARRAGCSAAQFDDMLSGYRVLSRRFVKIASRRSSREFEIETELTVHALQMRMPIAEVDDDLQGAAAGLDQQAAHLPRRLADPHADRPSDAQRAAAAVLRADRPRDRPQRDRARRAGRRRLISIPASCRGCPRRSSASGSSFSGC